MKNKSIASLSLRKLILSVLVAAPLATLPAPLWALPSSASNLANQVNATSSGVSVGFGSTTQVNVTSTSTYGVVKWNDFGDATNMTIGAGDTITYTMPSSTSGILNMVVSSGASHATTINGTLNTGATGGNIWVLNPNGVTIGSTGVISATGVGLSTVPETEYNFLANGTLTFVQNQPTPGAGFQPVVLSPGSRITAASGTGNIWIASAGGASATNLAGTVDGGNITVAVQNGGNLVLGAGGNLVFGDASAKAANVSVTASNTGGVASGTVVIGDAVANSAISVLGSSASITTGNAAISQAGTGGLVIGAGGTANSTLTVNSGTGNITLGNVSNNNGNTLTVNATGNTISVTAPTGALAVGATAAAGLTVGTGAGNLTLNAGNVTGTLNATAVGGNIISGGAVAETTGANLTADAGKSVAFTGTGTLGAITLTSAGTLGNVSLTNANGSLVVPTLSAANFTATATGNITQSGVQTVTGGNATFTSSAGNITFAQAVASKNLTVTTQGSGKNITQGSAIAISATTAATFNSAGDLTLDAQTTPTISATAAGNITISGAETPTSLTLNAGKQLAVNAAVTAPTYNATAATMVEGVGGTIVSTGTSTLNASTSIALGNSNDFGTLVLQNAPSGITLTDINGVILGNATNTTGNVTLTTSSTTAGNVQFGSASGDVLTFGGNLSIDNSTTANGNISQANNALTVLGSVTLKTAGTGTINLSGATGNGIGLANQFGQVNLTTAGANATVFEATTLNLGNVSLGAGALNAYSATSVINTGQLSLTGGVLVGAGTATNPGDIALNYDSTTVHNAIGGTITLQNDLQLLAPSSNTIGNYLAKSLTVTNGISGNGTLVNIPVNVYGNGTTANISLTDVGAANLGVGALNTTGTVALTSGTGSITATNAGNTFGVLTVTSANTTAGSLVSTTKDLTVNGTLSGTQTIGISSSGNVTIGSYTSSDTAATTLTATKALSDSVAGISIYGAVSFNGASISITKAGHNFGAISATTTGNGAATITESGTSNYASISTGSGAISATSTNGDIIQTGAITTTGNATFSAQSGNVSLTNAGNSLGGVIALTAKTLGNVINTGNTSLGNVTVSSGGLTVDLTGTANKNVTEASGAKIYTYGATAFKVAGTGTINVSNSGNQFGGVTVQTANSAATIKESTTLNLASVSVGTGAFTATSENGSIVDSGTVTATGTTAYSAPNGSILLTKTASDYGTVSLTTNGNVTITDANSIVLDTSTIGGTLSVTAGSTTTLGNISQLGAVTVGGATTFLAPNATSAITLNNSANQFGAFTFKVGSNGAIIDESTTFNLAAGSNATGNVTVNTSGDFVTSGTGGSIFSANLTINAPSGTITPGVNSLSVASGTFTVTGLNANLVNLSKTADLGNKDPIHTGITGTYTAPSP